MFGLASYVAERRTKEIGIRKVLGATVGELWQMLSWEFVELVIISCAVAIPLSYYFMSNWLENFEYRTDMSVLVFAVAGAAALGIALLTVSFQILKIIFRNPVESLRIE